VADKVMRMPDTVIRRQPSAVSRGDDRIQAKPG
jgi:hypothetical protein